MCCVGFFFNINSNIQLGGLSIIEQAHIAKILPRPALRVLARIEKLPVQKNKNDVFTNLRWGEEGHRLISGTQPSRIVTVLDGVAS